MNRKNIAHLKSVFNQTFDFHSELGERMWVQTVYHGRLFSSWVYNMSAWRDRRMRNQGLNKSHFRYQREAWI